LAEVKRKGEKQDIVIGGLKKEVAFNLTKAKLAQFRHLDLISRCFPFIVIKSLVSDPKVVLGHLIASKVEFET